ncbi:hypothetical protein [Methanogenium cariaci]|uniref:hypothetical protein n=1 Tax=Methanogenium cariaci TaxID=2197 RepID=UPI000786026F|nr:hypothetical protein [Methanogenium cariaci]
MIDKDYEIQRICVIQENRTYPLRNGPGCFVETVQNREIMDLTADILKAVKIWGVSPNWILSLTNVTENRNFWR